MPTWVVSAFLDDDLLALNRAMGIIRRRNIQVPSISLGPCARAGVTRLTCIVESDEAATERMANQLRKMVGVSEVLVYAESECAGREHALARVRVSPAQLSALLDTVALYDARIVEESAHDLLLEATGTAPFMLSLLRALEPFGIIDLARGGMLALPPASAPEAEVPPAGLAAPRVASAIPA
jgi:acetolactate synthase I/III small subunit